MDTAEPIVQTTYVSATSVPQQAVADLIAGLKRYELWSRFALHDIRQRFKRSLIGPLWLTLSMGVMIASMGLVFSTLFGQPMGQTLPYIAVGFVLWGLFTSCISEGATVFVAAESQIRNVPLPISVHFYRMLTRNLIVWAFNMVIYLLVLVVFRIVPGPTVLLFFPGFLLFFINTAWLSLAAGVLSTRFRDIPQVINSVIQVVFFLTPVFWSMDTLPHRPAFVTLNPIYHMLETVRAPMLGQPTHLINWLVSIGLAVVGCLITLWLYRRAHSRIAYWV